MIRKVGTWHEITCDEIGCPAMYTTGGSRSGAKAYAKAYGWASFQLIGRGTTRTGHHCPEHAK